METTPFTVTVTDDFGGTTTQLVSLSIINVDDKSIVTGGSTGGGEEDAGAVTGRLKATDIEGLSDGTYFSIAKDPSNGSAHIDITTGEWSYTPNIDFFGDDSFTVIITDDLGGTSNHPVDLNITPIEDTARIDGDTEGAGQEDNTITGNLKAVDPDGLTDNTYFSIEDYGSSKKWFSGH